MKQASTRFATFLRCYQSLMTFFRRYLPGELWIAGLFIGMFVNLFLVCKNRSHYPMPGRFKIFVIAALILSGIFTVINFFLCLWPLEAGSPKIVDGSYVLDYKGTIAKYITEEEYHRLKCIEQRLFSGHLLFFYAGTMYLHLKSEIKFQMWTPNRMQKGDL